MKIFQKHENPLLQILSPNSTSREDHLTNFPMLHRRSRRRSTQGVPAGRSCGSGFSTPLLRWKFNYHGTYSFGSPAAIWLRRLRPVTGETVVVTVSARKLAAGLWWLAAEVNGWQFGHSDRLRFKSSLAFDKSAREGATRWSLGFPKLSAEICLFQSYTRKKLPKTQQVNTVSVVTALEKELVRAQTHIQELETERLSSKKKVEHFLKKLNEERESWMRKEHHKAQAVLEDLKHELSRETRNRQKLEVVNSKILIDLADSQFQAKKFMQKCERQRKTRVLLEEVCNELVKKIKDDQAEVEALKMVSMRFHEEVEEERQMLQLAEVWREEQVQMKLLEAKMVLEEKYEQMNNLISNLEHFLGSENVIQDKLCNIPTTSVGLKNSDAGKKEIAYCHYHSPASLASGSLTVISQGNGFEKIPAERHLDSITDRDSSLVHANARETPIHEEDPGSCYNPDESISSVVRLDRGGRKHVQDSGKEFVSSELSVSCSTSIKQSKKMALPLNRLQKPGLSNGNHSKRPANGSTSNMGIVSSQGRSSKWRLSHQDSKGHWSLTCSGNPHLTQGMRGFIEWPKGIQRHKLNSTLLGARVKSQRAKLRNTLHPRS